MNRAKIIVLAGQSNAVGVGHTPYLSRHFPEDIIAQFKKGYENILLNFFSHDFKSGGFVKTTLGCAEKSKDTFGPEVGIAQALCEKYPDEKFYIVKCAFGGTSLFHDWLPPSCKGDYKKESFALGDEQNEFYRKGGWCYNELVNTLGDSIRILENQGLEPEIIAFCWMQGESDAISPEHFADYGERYENMLKDLRGTFEKYFENCVYIDAGISEVWQYYREVNTWKEAHALEAENSFFIDTIEAGLTTSNEPQPEVDIAHYDSDCTIKLGRLFAEKIVI